MTDQNLRKNSDSIEAYERYARVRRYQNNEFKQILRGFKKLGLTDKQINEGAKSMGVSKERLKHNAVGYMNRPIISSYLQDRMNQTRNGRSRFNAVRKHYLDKYPDKFLPIDQ